jgi:hypothetical protein
MENRVSVRGLVHSLAAVFLVAACADQTGPAPGHVAAPQFETVAPDTLHIIRQAPTAPALETYQTSFWVQKGKATIVVIEYQSPDGQKAGDPFLTFGLPKDGLISGADGRPIARGDSILLTLDIDPVAFSADFGPSGVKFSAKSPASLTMCYEHMDPDLNRDGVVDSTDAALQQQLSFWTQSMKAGAWFKLPTKYDPANPCVSAQIFHFSQYAVSW